MSSDSREEWSSGKLVRMVRGLPPIRVDASTWEPDIPADQWSEGRLVHLPKAVLQQKVDCSTWDTPPWLELVVAFAPGSSPLHAIEQANRVIGLLQAGASLAYDASRSRTEEEAFIIALVPANRATEEQLASMVASLPPGSPTVRVARAA